jgi:head-tail adaptor
MNVRAMRHRVTLSDPVDDGTPKTFTPAKVWAAVRPASPGSDGETHLTHVVEMRYHPQITLNTCITHRDRKLFVKGIQNVDERNRALVLLCEEVQTP